MNIEEGRNGGVTSGNPLHSGVENYPPQPSAPHSSAPPPPYAQGIMAGQGHPVVVSENDPLPCGGIGEGWVLFILGFFLGAIPWYIGAMMLCCKKDNDKREKPGLTACAVFAVFGTIVIIVAVAAAANNNNNGNSNY